MVSSELNKFYEKTLNERLGLLKNFANLPEEEIQVLQKFGALDFDSANRMIENVVSSIQLPLGIATNFLINGKDFLIPMAIEEPSVVAAASNAAKLCRHSMGFIASADPSIMIGQIQVVRAKNLKKAGKEILRQKKKLLDLANSADSILVSLGGGAKDLKIGILGKGGRKFLSIHLLVDVKDAMGANAVNSMCERIAPEIEKISNGIARLKILSNLAVYRKARAKAIWPKKALEESFAGKLFAKNFIKTDSVEKEIQLKGDEIVEAILEAFYFAENCAFRAATHNKGIMNGIDAVAIACGQDWRAIEAGCHAYAARSGKYSPLTKYYKNKNGDLVGEIELPIAVGLVGGATKSNPVAKICLKLLNVGSAQELSMVLACVGLAQNFAALRALANEGIQKGHMKLHAKNIALNAGAKGKKIDEIAEKLIAGKNITIARAKELIGENIK